MSGAAATTSPAGSGSPCASLQVVHLGCHDHALDRLGNLEVGDGVASSRLHLLEVHWSERSTGEDVEEEQVDVSNASQWIQPSVWDSVQILKS